jgi:anti-sigma factor RsiW
MHFSEDDLRSALRRKDPGASFTQRVMARIHQAETNAPVPRQPGKLFRQLWWPLRLRPVLAGVIIAVLAVGGWLGLMKYRQVQEVQAGEHAKQQAILALRITNAKLNHVFERVKASQAREVKIRRERL